MPEEFNFDEEIDRAVNADPFAPFTIVTACGDRYEVSHPNLIAFGGDVIMLLRPRVGSIRLRSYNVTALEIHESAH
jgi:hypothetical protein